MQLSEALEEAGEEVPEGKHELAIMSGRGDTKTIWDPGNAVEVEMARKQFTEFRSKGFLAFSVTGKDGEKGQQINTFDPQAGRIIMSPPIAGGA
jgi:hypothetical protein